MASATFSLPLSTSTPHNPPSTHRHSESSADSNDDDPFNHLTLHPTLPRTPFLSPTFNAATFLASLPRLQTLPDLQSDLQARSASIQAELSTLVNDEYASFLALGNSLRGGEDKVGEVSVGVRQFRGNVAGLRDNVGARRREVEKLVQKRMELVKERERGMEMLRVHERVEGLERILAGGEDEEDQEDDLETPEERSLRRLKGLAVEYRATREQLLRLGGEGQPFLKSLLLRLQSTRKTILLDLAAAVRLARKEKEGGAVVVKLLALYDTMGETSEAIQVLKNK